MTTPIVIAHRGASGYVPEHTLSAYFIAVEMGADFIEPDLVITRDGVLVARHENEISGTTDVAQHPEFAARRTTKRIDGQPVTGWFTEDFTLAEIKRLRARERIAGLRPSNAKFDGMFEIPTFEEILSMAHDLKIRSHTGGAIGVYPETKHPSYFREIGLPLEEPLIELLHRYGYAGRQGRAFIQSFEVANLQAMRGLTQLPLVQLLDDRGQPWDSVVRGESRSYADMVTPAGLRDIAHYADAVGCNKNMIVPRNAQDTLGTPTTLVDDAHRAGLAVHAWTFRAENQFLPGNLRMGSDDGQPGSAEEEILTFLRTGLDGVFCDHPDRGVAARLRLRHSQP